MAVLVARFSSTLSAAINSSQTTIELSSATGFPSIVVGTDHVNLSIEDTDGNLEVVKVTAQNGTTLTVERGISNTVARAFPARSIAEIRNDPLTVTEFTTEIAQSAVDEATVSQGGGLNQGAVDRRIESKVKPFAQTGNAAKAKFNEDIQDPTELNSLGPADVTDSDDMIVVDKLPTNEVKRMSFGAAKDKMTEDIEDWAMEGNTDQIPASKIPAGSGGTTGLTSVATDSTITGDGTAGSVLSVANPFTDDDESKLDGIDDNATDDQTAEEIKTALETLQGTNRLNASAVQGLPTGGTDDQNASEVTVNTTNFGGNLTTNANTVQKALDEVDNLTLGGGGGGTDDQNASEVSTSTTNFNNNLSSADNDVQKALDTLDNVNVPTASDIENIVHKEAQAPLEEVAKFSNLTGNTNDAPGAEADESRIGAGTFTDNLGSFTQGSSTFILRRIVTDPSDGLLSVVVSTTDGNNTTNAAKLNGLTVDINGDRANLGKASVITASNYISYDFRFRGDSDPIMRNANNVVTFYESLSSDSYVSKESVYNEVKEIIGGGEGISTNNDDANESISIYHEINRVRTSLRDTDQALFWRDTDDTIFKVSKAVAQAYLEVGHDIPTGTDFPVNPVAGDRIIILSDTTIPQDRHLRVNQTQATLREVILGTGAGNPTRVYAYASNYTGTGSSSVAGRLVVLTAGAPTKTMDKLVFHTDRGREVEYTINRNFVAGLQHFYLVDSSVDYNDFQAGRFYYFNIIFTDGTKLFPDAPFAVGDYTYTGTEWIFTPGVAADWASQGRPEPRTLLSVESLDSTNIGLGTTNSSQERYGAFQAFTRSDGTNFDVDANPTGVIEVQVNARITGRSDNQIGFTQNYNSATDPSIDRSGFTGISKVTTFTAGSDSGFEIFEADIYRGTTLIDKVRFAISKNANPYLGYNLRLSGESGSYNYSVTVTVNTFVLHNDGPGSTTFLGLIDTPNDYEGSTGKPLVGAGDSIVFGEFPTGGGGTPAFNIPDLYVIRLTAYSGGQSYSAGPTPPARAAQNGINRKYVQPSSGGLVENDWSQISLIANNVATHGVTIANNRITFANATKIYVAGVIETECDDGGGAGRAYQYFRCVKIGTQNEPVLQSQTESYNKTTSYDETAQATLQQGPRYQLSLINFMLDVSAGDVYEFQWKAYIQTSGETRIVEADSVIDIRFFS